MSGFLNWWQHLPEKMNPVIFELGPIKPQYYGLMYIVAFLTTYLLVLYRLRQEKTFQVTKDQVLDLTAYMVLGLIIGARLGYVLFYNFSYYFRHPLEIFLPFEFSNGITFIGFSGMSYHGGLVGVILSAWLYIRKKNLNFWKMVDLYVPVIPLGYTFGRIGNFINGELYGRETAAWFGMYFPAAPGAAPRHPSQLYEAFFEGIFLFTVLWSVRKIPKGPGTMLAYYLFGYGVIRFVLEYFRQPDAHIGFVFMSLSMGQILCGAMAASGALMYYYLNLKKQ
jgi:phosphatidylglycerol:prolipoprotein diacylglycerol transferase